MKQKYAHLYTVNFITRLNYNNLQFIFVYYRDININVLLKIDLEDITFIEVVNSFSYTFKNDNRIFVEGIMNF